MAYERRMTNWRLFRLLVIPAGFLSAIFRRPANQWIAVSALAVWLCFATVSALSAYLKRRRRRKAGKAAQNRDESDATEKSCEQAENDLFLIRQTDFRITEKLRSAYPAAFWQWTKRPDAAQLCEGGIWRISTGGTDPFDRADVEIGKNGGLVITMLQPSPLAEVTARPDSDDLEPDEILEDPDVKKWYCEEGAGEFLGCLIDDLNARGYRRLIIREDGSVCVGTGASATKVETMSGFPPRSKWEEFCRILLEDDISAQEMPDGLALAWRN